MTPDARASASIGSWSQQTLTGHRPIVCTKYLYYGCSDIIFYVRAGLLGRAPGLTRKKRKQKSRNFPLAQVTSDAGPRAPGSAAPWRFCFPLSQDQRDQASHPLPSPFMHPSPTRQAQRDHQLKLCIRANTAGAGLAGLTRDGRGYARQSYRRRPLSSAPGFTSSVGRSQSVVRPPVSSHPHEYYLGKYSAGRHLR